MTSSESKTRRYRFEPLTNPRAEIRILSIHSRDADGNLQCSLETRRLDDNPYYVAVSYECGDPDLEVDIKIDDKFISIRHNLWLFLEHLFFSKRRLVKQDSFRVWADAVCIDQKNLEEKKDQISLMSRIFKQADSVYAWLGWTSKFESQSVLASLTKFVSDFQGRRVNIDALTTHLLSAEWQFIVRMMKLSYWSRRWVVQELLLARNVTVISNTIEVPWYKFQKFFKFIDYLVTSWEVTRQPQQKAALVLNNMKETIPFQIWVWSCVPYPNPVIAVDLSALITSFAPTICEMEHDKIYSLLGLIRNNGKIEADYRCSMQKLLCRIFTPSSPNSFSFSSLVRLAKELEVVPHSAKISLENLEFLEYHFQPHNIDRIIGSSTSNKWWGDLQRHIGILRQTLSSITFCYSYSGSRFHPTLKSHFPKHLEMPTQAQGVGLYITSKGYVAVSSTTLQPGDIVCPITDSTTLIVRRALGVWSVIGLALIFHLDKPSQPLRRCIRNSTYPSQTQRHIASSLSSYRFSILDRGRRHLDMSDPIFREFSGHALDKSAQTILADANQVNSLFYTNASYHKEWADCYFAKTSFDVCFFISCHFSQCRFSGCRLRECVLTDCIYTDCNLDRCKLTTTEAKSRDETVDEDFQEQNSVDEELRDRSEQKEFADEVKGTLILYLEINEAVQLAKMFDSN